MNNAASATATQYYNSASYKYSLASPSTATSITNWSFAGWRSNSDPDAKDYSAGATITSSNSEYFAVYSRTVTINYDANGGSGTMSPSTQTVYLNSYSTVMSPQSIWLKNNGSYIE